MNPSERPLCILVTGEPVPATLEKRGSFAELLQNVAARAWTGSWLVVDCRRPGRLPAPTSLAGLVVTGSPHSVTDREPWVLNGEAYLADVVAAGVPVLGVCFGHQMLAQALGGRVARNPRGREIGTVELALHADDPLFRDDERSFRVNMSHVDTVVELPASAEIVGSTKLDACAAVRFGERAWGVQFHPEFDREIVGHYAMARADSLREEGLDPDAIAAAASDAQPGARVLLRFVDLLNS
ncbi:MAG TPA: glutamine amidotransferase [Polyangiaceae bacterium]|nr:glutamine amidotransferase [Polyangiaceae bacterium]